jgi:Flp pilus assembly pilin Flp
VTTLLLTILRFSGTLAAAYGQERAQLQGLTLLAIALCWPMQRAAEKKKKPRRLILPVIVACLAVVLVSTSYLAGAVLGGGISANLTNSGAAYENFYATTPEFAAAQWLGKFIVPGQLVYADQYGQLRLAEVTNIEHGLTLDLTPLTIDQNAWVYASRANVVNHQAFAVYNNHSVTFVFPASFLSANYDLVYTDGSSEVYHR